MVLLGNDLRNHISGFDTDVLQYLSDEEKYNRLIELHPGFDQWQFFYEMLKFSRLVEDFIIDMKNKSKSEYARALIPLKAFYDINARSITSFNENYNLLHRLGAMKKYAIHVFSEHPYMDYAIILNSKNNDIGDTNTNIRPLVVQEFDSDLWKTINAMVRYHKDHLPFIYDNRGMPLDFLLRKWNTINNSKPGSVVYDTYKNLEKYNVDRISADSIYIRYKNVIFTSYW